MQRYSVLTAAFVLSSLFFTQACLAEESAAFVARNAALQQRAADAALEQIVAKKNQPDNATSGKSAQDS